MGRLWEGYFCLPPHSKNPLGAPIFIRSQLKISAGLTPTLDRRLRLCYYKQGT